MNCPECGGDGWVPDHAGECSAMGECIGSPDCPELYPCDRCEGTGTVEP